MSTTVEQDLRQQRVAPLYYLKIGGLPNVYCTQHHLGYPSDWGRTFVPVLNLPEEFSTDLDLGEMAASMSAMEPALNDYKDADCEWVLEKLFSPGLWDTGNICNLLPGTAANQQVDADATTISVKSTTGFPSSGTAYIGQECFTYAGVTATSLTGCTRGLYPPYANVDAWTQTFRRHEDSQKGMLHHISQYPYTHSGRPVTFWVTTWDQYNKEWKQEPGSSDVWTDAFSTGTVGADWTQSAGNGSIVETGGALELRCPNATVCYFDASTKNRPIVKLPLADIATVDEALYCVETEVALRHAANGYSRAGIAIMGDEENWMGVGASVTTGNVPMKSVSNSFTDGSYAGATGLQARRYRLYWNPSASAISIEDGAESLASGSMSSWYSDNAGSTYTKLETAVLANDATSIALWAANSSVLYEDVDGIYSYVTVTRTVDGVAGAKMLWAGRISTDESIRWDGSTGRWHLGCKSVMDDLAKPLADELPFNYINRINLQGDIGRGFVVHVFDENGSYVDACTVEVAKSRYTAPQLVKAIQDEFDDTANWESGAPDVVLMVCLEGDGARFDVRNSGANEVRHIRIDPDGLGKGEFSHALTALGFDGWIDTEFDMTGGGDSPYGGNITSSKYYDDYHPLHRSCNGGILYVYRADDFWADQGGGDSVLGNVVINDAYLVGHSAKQEKGSVFVKYASANTTTHQLTISAIYSRHAVDGYAGKKHNEEPVKVEQVYIPVYDPSGSTSMRGPFEQLLYPLLSTGTTGYNESDFSYDDLVVELSMGVHESLVDVQSFLDADKRALAMEIGQRPLHPWGKKDTWLSRAKEECKLFGYALTWRRGKITLVNVASKSADLVDVTINESVNAEASDQTQGIGTVVNRYVVELVDPTDKDNKQTYNVSDVNSITSHQVVKEVSIKHGGIPFWDHAVNINSYSFNHLIDGSMGRPSIIVPVTLPYAYVYRVWAGSTVRFISSRMPDPSGSGTRAVNALATVLGVQWDHVGKSGAGTLALNAAFSRVGTPYAPSALVDITATNGGWDDANDRLTLVAIKYGETGDPDDGAALAPTGGEKLRIIDRNPADPTSPTSWSVVALASTPYETAGAELLSLAAGTTLAGWDSDAEYVVTFDDWDTPVVSAQESLGTWQADETTELLDSGGDNDPPQRHG